MTIMGHIVGFFFTAIGLFVAWLMQGNFLVMAGGAAMAAAWPAAWVLLSDSRGSNLPSVVWWVAMTISAAYFGQKFMALAAGFLAFWALVRWSKESQPAKPGLQ